MSFIRFVVVTLAMTLAPDAQLNAQDSPDAVTVIESPFLTFDWSDALSASADVQDFDGDGDLDVVIANGRHWPQRDMIYFNTGNGRMLAARPIGDVHLPTYQYLSSDLDRDGDLDLVAILDDLPARIFLNDGTGGFGFHSLIEGTGGDSRGATLADINGDAILDLIIARRGDPDLVLRGIKGVMFAAPETLGPADSNSIRVEAADMDNDGDMDLLFARRGGYPNVLYINDGAGNFSSQALPGGIGNSRHVIAANLDGSGPPEIVACNLSGEHVAYTYEKKAFVSLMRFGSGDQPCYAVAARDIDGDGKDDLAVANSGAPDALYLSSKGWTAPSILDTSDADTYGITIADVSGDSQPDVIVARSGAPNTSFILRRAQP